jgi:hypothetical protein
MISAADHAVLDQQLLGLLPLLDSPAQHAVAQAQARNILDAHVGRLLRPDWEQHWRKHEEVSWGWFNCMGEAQALHAAVTEMVRFVLGGGIDYRRASDASSLRKALGDYLDRRGRQVPPPGGAQTGRITFDDLTQTVSIDGAAHHVLDPKAYVVYKAIATCPECITQEQIRGQVRGVDGEKTICKALAKLPAVLKKTYKSGYFGYRVCLPPRP